MADFPVLTKLKEIAYHLSANRDVVLTAPPGSGKTTCVPPALLNEPWLKGKKIIMLEPRRIAARNSAMYIASKLGERVGETVGYQVRLERKVSPRTRLEVVTEGLLVQRILADPELSEVGLIIFDEFHERSLACDLSFALALEVRRALRPDLRLLVMSATLNAEPIAAHLGDAEMVHAEGRMYPVTTYYLGAMSMASAIAKAKKETSGDILCFLPGESEIRKVKALVPEALMLFGALPKEEQDRVFEPSNARKIILATSIAETSITIPGITCVIDSGLMRVPRFSSATGMTRLMTLPLTLDRAEQRRGRAGRVQAGVCYRLWDETDNASRPKAMSPEILDADLAPLVMTSVAWGALKREALPYLTLPPASAWEGAVSLLKLLGALDNQGALTEKGKLIASKPMHPRLANMVLLGKDASAGILAAIVEEGAKHSETDIRKILDEVKATPNKPYSHRILELAKRFSTTSYSNTLSEGELLALAYPDRVAKNRGNGTFVMVSGRGAYLEESDALAKSPYIVACELDDRPGDAKIFLASPIDEREVELIFKDQITEVPYCEWDRRTDSVKAVVKRQIGAITLSERPINHCEEALDAMVKGIRLKGVENLPCWTKETRQLKARVDFLTRHLAWPKVDDERLIAGLSGFIGNITKWRDLEKLDLFKVYEAILSEDGHTRRELDQLAPAKMEVPTGSNMTIHYEGDEPTVEVRLQECFGLFETPKLAGGKVPIVMTLLSPAQRPIQITKDLATFWREGYQLVRKDMRGRYPKHYWPEDPLTATATRKVRPHKVVRLIMPILLGLSLIGYAEEPEVNLYPNGTNDMTHALMAEVARATKAGEKIIELANADYHFYSTSATKFKFNVSNHDQPMERPVFLPFVGVTNLTISARAAKFIMHGMGTALLLKDTLGVKLEGVTIEWEKPYFAQAEIVGFEAGKTRIKFLARDQIKVDNGRLILSGEDWHSVLSAGMLFDHKTHEIIERSGDIIIHGKTIYNPETSTFLLAMDLSKFGAGAKVGDILVMRSWYRPYPIVCLDHAKDTTFKRFVFRDGFGMGLLAQLSENITLDGGGSYPRNQNEYSSNTIDATHFSNCRGLVTVENCHFEGMLDDALNVHSTSLRIEERRSDTVIRVKYMHHQAYDLGLFAPGDKVRFIAGQTLENGYVGTLKSVERLNTYEVVLTFTAPIPKAYNIGDAIENADYQCAVNFRNNYVANNRARGVLFTTPKKIVCENNRFVRVSGAAILLAGDAMGWYESGACENLTIRSNKFIDCMTSRFQYCDAIISIHPEVRDLKAQKQRYHRNIVIENNDIVTFKVPLLFALSVQDLVWRNNKVTYHARYAPVSSEPFVFHGCDNCVTK